MLSTYEKDAIGFLDSHDIRFSVKVAKEQFCPTWCSDNKHIHGKRYYVNLRKQNARVSFYFWGSMNDAEKGKAPTPYGVLACVSGDVFCPDTVEEFCQEFGYENNPRTRNVYQRCRAMAIRLNRFFTPEEIEELQEIR